MPATVSSRLPGTGNQSTNAVTGAVSRDFDINPYSYALNSSRTLDPNEYYVRNYAPFNIKNELDNNYMDYDIVDLEVSGRVEVQAHLQGGNQRVGCLQVLYHDDGSPYQGEL